MRLRDIRKIVSDNVKLITFDATGSNDGAGGMELSNYIGAINAIDNLKEFKFIESEIELLKSLPGIYFNKGDEDKVRVSQQQYQSFLQILEKAKLKFQTIIEIIDESVPEEQECSVSVKLPEYDDLSKVSRFFSDLNNSLTMAFSNPNIHSKVELQTFESGSMWITIVVSSQIAVKFISNIAHAALTVKKEYYEIEKTKLQVQAYGVQVQFLKDFEEKANASLGLLVEAQAFELKNKQDGLQNADPEYTERLKQSIFTMSKLFFEGAEIHKSLNAPSKDTDIKFPEYPKIQTAAELKRLMEPDSSLPIEETVTGNDESIVED